MSPQMATQPYSHAVGAGETLIVEVYRAETPFTWTAKSADWTGTTLTYDGSISAEPEDWIEPVRNHEITGDVKDYELDPFRYMRFRSAAGGNPVTITIATAGRVVFREPS